MASKGDILTAVADELTTLIADSSVFSVEQPADHVGVLRRHDRSTYPFLGIEALVDSYVRDEGRVEVRTDETDTVTGDTVADRWRLAIDVAYLVDDANYSAVWQALDEVKTHFRPYTRSSAPQRLHPDTRRVEFTDADSIARPGDGVVGERCGFDIEYLTYQERSLDAMDVDFVLRETAGDGSDRVYTDTSDDDVVVGTSARHRRTVAYRQ